ncbi:hypothetical protein Pint_07790 [Pistacia integerrima]|nr:hypothetical protein Pint_07790 [Pistacia integerrima]
MKKKVT